MPPHRIPTLYEVRVTTTTGVKAAELAQALLEHLPGMNDDLALRLAASTLEPGGALVCVESAYRAGVADGVLSGLGFRATTGRV